VITHSTPGRAQHPLEIVVTAGSGSGPTPIAAFDHALIEAGIANYNLLCLSSVIPAGSRVVRRRFEQPAEEYGHRLYAVLAHLETRIHGESVWAGLGWVQASDSGKGLLVEIHGTSRRVVERGIERSLAAMVAHRGEPYGPIQSEIIGIECHAEPVSALVAAVYQSRGWTED
jgi:arginine decarboxylase